MSPALLVTFVVLTAVELASIARDVDPSTWPPLLGFVAMGVALPTAAAGLADALARLVLRSKRPAALAMAVAAAPALLQAALLTEGKGISKSPLYLPVFLAIALILVGAVGLSARLAPRLRGSWLGAAIFGLAGVAALAVASIQPLQYVRPHRGVLVIAALCLEAAASAAVPALTRPRRFVPLALAGLFALGFGAAQLRPERRSLVLYQIFNHALITQKYQALLTELLPEVKVSAHAAAGIPPDALEALPPPARARYGGMNVLYFTGDTMRADRFPPDAVVPGLTPNVDRLADESIVFAHAVTNYSFTDRSIPVFLSGDWDERFAGREDPKTRLPRLFERGRYHTIGIMGGKPQLRQVGGFVDRRTFQGDCKEGVAQLDEALGDAPVGRPFFAWMHSIDAHAPHRYDPDDLRFGDGPVGTYDAAIHHFDACLGLVVEALKRRGLYDHTLIVIASDHGESLGERGRTLLHESCFLPELKIPLIVRLPGLTHRIVPAYRAQTIDLLPTIADLTGLDVTGEPMIGRDLTRLFDLDRAEAKDAGLGWALSQGGGCAAHFSDRWLLIHFKASRHFELYDVIADPNATKNLVAERPEIVDALSPVLLKHLERPGH